MKRLIIFILSLLTLVSCDNTIRFLDIPIKGSRNMMVKKLEEKGFVYDYESDLMKGTFNEELSDISIFTSNGEVNKIRVCSKAYNDKEIKAAYNKLLKQFKSNPKYIALKDYNPIPEGVSVFFNMKVIPTDYKTVFYRRKEFNRSYSINPDKAEGVVWFKIVELYGDYFIQIYYENLKKHTINSDL